MSGYSNMVQQWTISAEQAVAPAYALTNVPDFSNMIPNFIAYAEGRIYRDCVFLATRTQNFSLQMTAGSRQLSITPITPLLVTVEGFALITPVSATNPKNGTRQPFDATSLDAIDTIWPQESVTKDPSTLQQGRYWALKDNQTIVAAPTPDAAYTAEITGLFQPQALSATNTDTYLTSVYPDLMFIAGMIAISGFLRDYGAQSEDPKTGLSWEALYGRTQPGIELEEQRRRLQGVGWSQNMPTKIAAPPRT